MTTKPKSLPGLPVASFECDSCGTLHHAGPVSSASGLPVGWSTSAGIPARQIRAARSRRRAA